MVIDKRDPIATYNLFQLHLTDSQNIEMKGTHKCHWVQLLSK